MTTWRTARSLNVLLGEVNAAAPARSKVSDGTIGDAAHASRDSDHNPWVIDDQGVGVVRARDVTHDPAGGVDGNKLSAAIGDLLGKHPALGSGAYVIWNRRIKSTDRLAEGWRPYTGSNPHDHHVHVSVATARSGYDSGARWGVMMTAAQLQREARAAEDQKIRRALTRVIKRVKKSGRHEAMLAKLTEFRDRITKS